MSARVMNALGASELERTICATRRAWPGRRWRTASRRRSIPRSGRTRATCSSGAGTRCRPRRTCGASCSTPGGAVRGWWSSTRSAAARRGSPTSTCARCREPTPRSALGMMRAIVDAGLARRGLVPRAHRRLRRAARDAGGLPGRARGRDLRRRRGGDRARRRASSRRRSRRCSASGSAPSATSARRRRTARSPRCPRSSGAWRAPRAAAARTSRRPPPRRVSDGRARARRPAARARCARSTCPSSATR